MLTFTEWLKLSVKEKEERYKDLSARDKFLVRQGYYFEDNIVTPENFDIEIPDFLKEEGKNTNDLKTFK